MKLDLNRLTQVERERYRDGRWMFPGEEREWVIRIGDKVTIFEKWPDTKGKTFVVHSARDGIIFCHDSAGLMRAFPADCVDKVEDETGSTGTAGG